MGLGFKRVVAIVAIFTVFLLVTAPAVLVQRLLVDQPGLTLGGVSGSLWSGKFTSVSYRGVLIAPLRWQFQPLGLLNGELAIRLQLGSQQSNIRGEGRIGLSARGWFTDELQLTLPAEELMSLIRFPMGLTTDGTMRLALRQASQGSPWCGQLEGDIAIERATITGPLGYLPIDKLSAKLGCHQGQLTVGLDANTNSLGIDAKLVLRDKKRIELTGYIAPLANQPKELLPLLNYLPGPDAKGRYPLHYRGPIYGL